MRRPLTTVPLAVLLVVNVLAAMPSAAYADADKLLDYDIPNGHFYTQTNGTPGISEHGFRITNESGIPFWAEFLRLGGVDRLGYPISRRFIWHGLLSQATQKAVLQWSPESGVVQLANILDYLSEVAGDDWLQDKWAVPPREGAKAQPVLLDYVLGWLRGHGQSYAPFEKYFRSAPDPLHLYGLPAGLPTDLSDFVALRFQRTMLQLWKMDAPGASRGMVTSINAGDIIKQMGILPDEVLTPEDPPAPAVREGARIASRDGGNITSGRATWYGYTFQGRIMRNGERYDADDPAIAAANAFPLGSWLRVTNIENGAGVEVRVTDTGAFRFPIVVDLSLAAFGRLADPNRGIIEVRVQPLHRD